MRNITHTNNRNTTTTKRPRKDHESIGPREFDEENNEQNVIGKRLRTHTHTRANLLLRASIWVYSIIHIPILHLAPSHTFSQPIHHITIWIIRSEHDSFNWFRTVCGRFVHITQSQYSHHFAKSYAVICQMAYIWELFHVRCSAWKRPRRKQTKWKYNNNNKKAKSKRKSPSIFRKHTVWPRWKPRSSIARM